MKNNFSHSWNNDFLCVPQDWQGWDDINNYIINYRSPHPENKIGCTTFCGRMLRVVARPRKELYTVIPYSCRKFLKSYDYKMPHGLGHSTRRYTHSTPFLSSYDIHSFLKKNDHITIANKKVK